MIFSSLNKLVLLPVLSIIIIFLVVFLGVSSSNATTCERPIIYEKIYPQELPVTCKINSKNQVLTYINQKEIINQNYTKPTHLGRKPKSQPISSSNLATQ